MLYKWLKTQVWVPRKRSDLEIYTHKFAIFSANRYYIKPRNWMKFPHKYNICTWINKCVGRSLNQFKLL